MHIQVTVSCTKRYRVAEDNYNAINCNDFLKLRSTTCTVSEIYLQLNSRYAILGLFITSAQPIFLTIMRTVDIKRVNLL